jgi:hypothetical protein
MPQSSTESSEHSSGHDQRTLEGKAISTTSNSGESSNFRTKRAVVLCVLIDIDAPHFQFANRGVITTVHLAELREHSYGDSLRK